MYLALLRSRTHRSCPMLKGLAFFSARFPISKVLLMSSRKLMSSFVPCRVAIFDLIICFCSSSLSMPSKLMSSFVPCQQFFPSEFGMDPARMGDALVPGRVTFDEKMEVRKAIEDAKIPFTYVCGACFAGYCAGNLCQLDTLVPPTDKVFLYGDGNVKVSIMDEDDIAAYTVKAVDDIRAINKTLYHRPPSNIISQRELVRIWENLSGKILNKISIPALDFLASMKDMEYYNQVGMGHFYHVFYEGSLTNFETSGENHKEVSHLYPRLQSTTMESYLKRFL